MPQPSKGPRKQVPVRVPPVLKERWQQRADELGIPLGSWVTKVVNESLGYPMPSFVEDDLERARQHQRAQDQELQLPEAS